MLVDTFNRQIKIGIIHHKLQTRRWSSGCAQEATKTKGCEQEVSQARPMDSLCA